jgi:hypothetical protein
MLAAAVAGRAADDPWGFGLGTRYWAEQVRLARAYHDPLHK